MKHLLKCDPQSFHSIWENQKFAELRNNDRGFKVGDIIILNETKYSASTMCYSAEQFPLVYTGRRVEAVITHIQDGYGLPRDTLMLSFKRND